MFIARSINRIVALALVLVLAMSISTRVTAQGYRMGLSTALPRPISSLELSRYGEMLSLTAEQQRAWLAAHEKYKADFKALGEEGGVLQRFIDARKDADGVPFRAQPPRAVIERWMDAHQSATSAIRALDERLFDELLPLLTEAQQPLLQRARLTRERARLLGDELVNEWMNPVTQTSLSELFAQVLLDAAAPDSGVDPLSHEQSASVWAALDAHQAQLIGSLRDVQQSARGMYRDWARLLQEQGVPVNAVDVTQRDTLDREMFAKVSACWREVTNDVKPRINEMQRSIRKKALSVSAMLPSGAAIEFKREFYARAYPGAAVVSLGSHEQQLRKMLAAPDLTIEEKEALEARLADCGRTMLVLSEREADAQDLLHEGERPSSVIQSPEARAAMASIIADRQSEQERLDAALTAVVSPERMPALFSTDRDARRRRMLMAAGITDPGEMEDALAELKRTGTFYFDRGQSPDSLTPDALLRASLDAACRSVSLPDDALEIVGRLHRDYALQYRRTRDEALGAANKFALGGFRPRPDGRMGYATPDEVSQARAVEVDSVSKLRALDSALLADVQAAIGIDDDGLRRVRLARDWATLARGSRKSPDELRTYDAYVPLLSIVDGLKLAPEDQLKADAIFRARSEEFRNAAKVHFEANRAAWYAREMAFATRHGLPAAASEQPTSAEQAAIDAEKAAGEKRAALAAIVRSILDELLVALPAHAEALTDGYERAAYPRVFDDRKVHGDAPARALALPDLTAEQRTELQAAIARFRPAQREVVVRLIAANREWDKERPYSSFQNPEREEAKLKWNQIKFERDELDAGMLATLKRVLNPQQLEAIGVGSE